VNTSRGLKSFLVRMGEKPTGNQKADIEMARPYLPHPWGNNGMAPVVNLPLYTSGDIWK